MRRRLLYLLPVAVFAVVALWFAWALRPGHDPSRLPSMLIGKPAPEFLAPALSADLPGLARADLHGQIVLVNFLASWCVPCRIEHPLLMRLAAEKQVPIYGIVYKDKPEAAKAFLAELGNPYERLGMDDSGRIGIDFGLYGVPETYVIDADGIVRYREAGVLTDEQWQDVVWPLIQSLRGG